MSHLRIMVIAAIAMSSSACSAHTSHARHIPRAQLRGSMAVAKPEARSSRTGGARPRRSAASLIEDALHARGIRFGTDGSVPALFAFVQGDFERIAVEQVQDGDVIFFDTGSGCGGHAGLVEGRADAFGRIGFREWRNGGTLHSFVTPRSPLCRRDDKGNVLNTFLRAKHMDDSPDTRYFAGEMLCAAFRIEAK